MVIKENDLVVEVDNVEVLKEAYKAHKQGKDALRLIFLCYERVDAVFKMFKSLFLNIEAAGGLVRNERNELLMIFRLGKWDLPKGKIEKNESSETAAIREVNEETGLKYLQIIKVLEPTYHLYDVNDKHFLKKTFWYEMKSDDQTKPIPQTNEGITKIVWLDKNGVGSAMLNTYYSLLGLIEFYLEN